MPGTSPHAATQAFLAPFHENVAIFEAVAHVSVHRRGAWQTEQPYYWDLNAGDGVALRGVGTFYAQMTFKIIEIDPAQYDGDTYRVTTLGYNYKLRSDEFGGDLWRFHWHPTSPVSHHTGPHVHLPPDYLALPTDRLTFERAMRWCIVNGVPLTCDEAEADGMLATSEYNHQIHRSWRSALDQPDLSAEPKP